MTRARITAIALGALLFSCRYPVTEIVLRVETDMSQGPGQTLTAFRVVVRSQGEEAPRYDQMFQLGVGEVPIRLPQDVGITSRGNQGGRVVEVSVTALQDGTELFTYEAIAPFMIGSLRMAGVSADQLEKGLKHLVYSEYGGAPLLGVNGVSIISHGKSTSRAI